jgi:hypothetical protein
LQSSLQWLSAQLRAARNARWQLLSQALPHTFLVFFVKAVVTPTVSTRPTRDAAQSGAHGLRWLGAPGVGLLPGQLLCLQKLTLAMQPQYWFDSMPSGSVVDPYIPTPGSYPTGFVNARPGLLRGRSCPARAPGGSFICTGVAGGFAAPCCNVPQVKPLRWTAQPSTSAAQEPASGCPVRPEAESEPHQQGGTESSLIRRQEANAS